MNGEKIDIAVLCNTYNHAKYIRKALDGVVMQKTDYKYKVFVHDDASTDGTVDVLKEYQEKYPEILNVVYEKENQYSQGKDITGLMHEYWCDSRYVAWCEGDDEWFYPYKLQKQCEFMDSHPETMLCVHNAINWNAVDNTKECLINELESGYLNYQESIHFSKGHFPTCSFFFRTDMFDSRLVSKYLPPVGDDPLMYYSASKGNVYYIDKVWAVRNYMHPGSWNVRVHHDIEAMIDYVVRFVNYLNDFNNNCNKKMQPYILDVIMGLVEVGVSCYLNSEKYSFQELLKGIECLKNTFEHKFDDLCDQCMTELTKQCIDYPQVVKSALSGAQDKIYIYGAGSEAAKLYNIVDELGYNVEAFIVSKQDECREYLSHQVVSVDDIRLDNPNVTLMLGLGRKNYYQVINLLREKEVKSRIIYNGHNISI